MRITKLDLQAFGPFKNKVSLDFTNFKNENIFLVTGPTGSGKTSLFDAISYALFENTTGTGRGPKQIKSDFADNNIVCYVDLSFDHNTDSYRIIRKPEQKRYDEDLQRSKNQSASVQIFKNKTLISERNKTDSNKQIVDLLGMDYKQFSQIVLLAQGQFQKFLLSNSREKEEIFREIFDTEKFKKFEDALNKKVKSLEEISENHKTRVQAQLDLIQVEDGGGSLKKAIEGMDLATIHLEIIKQKKQKEKDLFDLGQLDKDLDREMASNQSIYNLLLEKERLDKEFEQLKQLQVSIESKEEAIQNHHMAVDLKKVCDELEEKENRLKKMKKNIQKDEKKRLENKKTLVERSKELDKVKKDYDGLDQDRIKLNDLEKILESFVDLKNLKDNIKKEEKKLSSYEKSLSRLDRQIEKLKEEKNKNKQKIDTINQLKLEKLEKESKLLPHKQNLDKKLSKKEKFNRVKELVNYYVKSQESYMTLEKDYAFIQQNYEKQALLYRQNQAGLLARELEEGQACPVCGSKNHPDLAQLVHADLNDQEMKKIEKEVSEALSSVSVKAKEIEQIKSQIDEGMTELEVDTETFQTEREKNLKQIDALQLEIDHIESWLKEVNRKIDEEDNLKNKFHRLEVEIEDNEKNKTELLVLQKSSQKTLEAILKSKSEKEEELSGKDEEESLEAKVFLEKKIKKIQELFLSLTEELQHLDKQDHLLDQSITMQKEQWDEREAEYQELNGNFDKRLVESSLEDDYKNYILEQRLVSSYEQDISTYQKDYIINQQDIKSNQENLTQIDQDILSISHYEKEILDLKMKKESNQEAILSVKSFLRSQEAIIYELENYQEKHEQVLKEYEVYQDLASIASGEAQETGKVSFERYVLAIYMDEILIAANRLFEEMTNGQFTLIREEVASNRQGKKGLDINVFDSYTGQERPVKTLSGGEIFKASLSLAIGMSDIIQQEAGGIQVEMLFIDEGFGSLDQESLDLAIESLMELNKSGRFIGIISHVEDLKNRIPAQITVKKSREGSSAQIKI